MTQGLMSPPSSSCSHTHSQLHSVHTFPCSLPFRSTVCNQIRAQTSFTSQEVKLTQSLPRGEMAQQGVELDRETFSCSICLDLLKDPVALHCGHSYCSNCIQSFWDVEDEKRIYSCPQCRQSFTPRPVLMENIMLADLVEKLKKTGLQDAPADHCYAGAEDVEEHKGHDTVSAAAERTERQRELEGSRQNIQRRIQDTEKDVKLLQQEVEAISRSADKAVEHSEKITELKRKDAELKKLSHTEDHSQFLHNYPSLSALSEATHSSSINIRPRRYFEDVTAAVSGVRDKLQDALRDTQTNVSLTGTEVDVLRPQPEPKTRAEFFRYSRHITLDPNTAFTWLLLSEGKRKAKLMTKQQSYPHHPDRFTIWSQVLSRESLTGRCYWEVERRGTVYVAVAYKNISRAGWDDECHFGHNEKSWMLTCDKNSYNFYHNTVQTRVSGPGSSRVGVYLDHSAGILSFYSVSKTMTLLHRVQTTFTQPLYAGLYFHDEGDTAELC